MMAPLSAATRAWLIKLLPTSHGDELDDGAIAEVNGYSLRSSTPQHAYERRSGPCNVHHPPHTQLVENRKLDSFILAMQSEKGRKGCVFRPFRPFSTKPACQCVRLLTPRLPFSLAQVGARHPVGRRPVYRHVE